MADTELDARGLNAHFRCSARKSAADAFPWRGPSPLATDPGAKRDVSAMCDVTGDRLIEAQEVDGVLTFWIEKGGWDRWRRLTLALRYAFSAWRQRAAKQLAVSRARG